MIDSYFPSKKKHLLQYTVTIVGIFCIFAPLYLFFPYLEAAFTNEGMFLEMLAVFLFAYCALKSGEIALLAKKIYTRGVGILLSAFSLLWLLQETSYGHNIFYRYDRPILYGTKIDTLHDLLRVLEHLIVTQPTSLVTILSLSIIGVIIASILWLIQKNRSTAVKFLTSSSALFLIITISLLILAGLFDLDPLHVNKGFRFFVFCEEYLEFAAAIAMVFSVRVFFKDHFDVIERK